jgi:two-component system, chemotaxis family, chemotaxis protein CheY
MALDFSIPVLVVDDYRTVARIVGRLLNQAGFRDVDEASDGEEALAKMRERRYGLVVSDWHMAPTSGFELLKRAKADEQLRDTPFVMISAEASPENATSAREAGASGYVVKPFDAQTLKARIASALAG